MKEMTSTKHSLGQKPDEIRIFKPSKKLAKLPTTETTTSNARNSTKNDSGNLKPDNSKPQSAAHFNMGPFKPLGNNKNRAGQAWNHVIRY
jgi:hypothetical protein